MSLRPLFLTVLVLLVGGVITYYSYSISVPISVMIGLGTGALAAYFLYRHAPPIA